MLDVRIGVVGSGGMAARHAEWFTEKDGFELIAIAARNPETGPALARLHGVECLPTWEALIDRTDVEAVSIATYNDTHAPIAIAALQAGKHVYAEYPAARTVEEANLLAEAINAANAVFRTAHNGPVSPVHQALRGEVAKMGDLMAALFSRLTPGRGRRPEILFNLNASGPPALFFVYHVYPVIDLFGPPEWVDCSARYKGLAGDGRYESFINSVVAGYPEGGVAQWNWAGGIDIYEAEETQRIVLTGGTLVRREDGWVRSTRDGLVDLESSAQASQALRARFLQDIEEGPDAWQEDARCAIDAVRVGLAAERSVQEARRVTISELLAG